MAITTAAVSISSPLTTRSGHTPWMVNASTADASGCESLKAAPGAGKKLFVEKVLISSAKGHTLYSFGYDGGVHAPVAGETINVDGEEGGETAVVESFTNAGGWAGAGTGTIYVYNCSSAFIANLAENDVIEDSTPNKICDTTGALTALPITVTLGSGEAASAVEAALIGPITMPEAGGTVVLDFTDNPIELTANKALTVDANRKGNICVNVKGFTD
jgi:hypothetical protein